MGKTHQNMPYRASFFLGILLSLAQGPAWSAPVRAAEPGDAPLWNLAWITDTQTPECEWINALLARVQANRPKMVIHTGDTRFEWANQCAWQDVMTMLWIETPPIELHLAPGNHDLTNGVLKPHLRRAATRGLYLLDTGVKAQGKGYYHDRVTEDACGPLWPVWNPEAAGLETWQPEANARPEDPNQPSRAYRYVFKRGGIRFIVGDCYYTDEQRDWVRNLIAQPDDSSVTLILQHKHEVDSLARYVEGLEGKHNVKLVLSGDHHHYCYEQRHGVTFITAEGIANGHHQDADAMTLWVYKDHLRLDRYVIPKGEPMKPIEGPTAIWSCPGSFSAYQRPAVTEKARQGSATAPAPSSQPAVSDPRRAEHGETVTPNLIYNGSFDNGVWYERFRGWSPAGWYQWFTRGGHAPEHAVGKRLPHSGKEYVRIHMWGLAWRGGVLQNVRGVEPCHLYRLSAYGFFQPEGAPEPHVRIGIDPCGTLAGQYAVDVTKHPAPKYDEGVGDDPKTPDRDGPDVADTTVWSEYQDFYRWGRFEVTAEARSDTVTAILYCAPKQRPADQPIYEMNWDTVSLYEVPWPTRRLADANAVVEADPRFQNVVVTIQPELKTAQVTWRSKIPAGASQVLYRFLDSEAVNRQDKAAGQTPAQIAVADFPLQTPVVYERSQTSHWVEIRDFTVPESAAELQVAALSRALVDGECRTLGSPVQRVTWPKP